MPERIARISGAEVLGFKCYRAPPTTDHIFASGSAGRVIEQHHDDRLLRPLSSLPSPKIAALVCQWQHWGSCTAALPHVTKVCFGPKLAVRISATPRQVSIAWDKRTMSSCGALSSFVLNISRLLPIPTSAASGRRCRSAWVPAAACCPAGQRTSGTPRNASTPCLG